MAEIYEELKHLEKCSEENEELLSTLRLGGVQDHFWLTAADGVIVATGTDDEAFESACRSIGLDPADETAIIDAAGQLITPGYVDIHAHGAWEHSFDDGPEGIDIARAGHAVHGTTRQVLSLITNPST